MLTYVIFYCKIAKLQNCECAPLFPLIRRKIHHPVLAQLQITDAEKDSSYG